MTPAASPATSQSLGRARPVRTAAATGAGLRLPVVLALLLAGCVLLAGGGTTATTSSPGAGTATAGSGASTAGSGGHGRVSRRQRLPDLEHHTVR